MLHKKLITNYYSYMLQVKTMSKIAKYDLFTFYYNYSKY